MPDEVLRSDLQHSLQWRVQCWVQCSVVQCSVVMFFQDRMLGYILNCLELFCSAAFSAVCSAGCSGPCVCRAAPKAKTEPTSVALQCGATELFCVVLCCVVIHCVVLCCAVLCDKT